MNSNNSGAKGYNADVYQNMAAYDRLPKLARQALAASDHNWSAKQVEKLHKGRKVVAAYGHDFDFCKASGIAEAIATQDALKHLRDAEAGIVAP